jgi:prepilin-type N-terminal cleavage/methylation domain-containing protein
LRAQSAFTLVELMAVIGIIALLAVVGVPAIKGLTGSGGRKQALGQLLGALEVARNTAISTGTNAAVIFPDSTFTSGDAYKYRSMAVVSYMDSTIVANSEANTTPIAYDKLVSSWIVLPQGISFLPAYLKTTTTTNMISVVATNIRIPPKTNPVSITCPGIIFQSNGGLLDGATNPIAGVGFFEGTVDTSGKTNPTSKMTNFETVRITRYTGRTLPTLAPAPCTSFLTPSPLRPVRIITSHLLHRLKIKYQTLRIKNHSLPVLCVLCVSHLPSASPRSSSLWASLPWPSPPSLPSSPLASI